MKAIISKASGKVIEGLLRECLNHREVVQVLVMNRKSRINGKEAAGCLIKIPRYGLTKGNKWEGDLAFPFMILHYVYGYQPLSGIFT